MKKLIFTIFIFLFIFGSPVFAQTATDSSKIDYQLPYPGILPDNPLYELKALRDRLYGFLISDPVKKSEFDLLQADKRVSTGLALFNKGKKELSESTISKGENYFEDALKNAKLAKSQGRELDPTLLLNFELSSKKHEQVIKDLEEKSSGKVKEGFSSTLKRILTFEKDAIELRPK